MKNGSWRQFIRASVRSAWHSPLVSLLDQSLSLPCNERQNKMAQHIATAQVVDLDADSFNDSELLAAAPPPP